MLKKSFVKSRLLFNIVSVFFIVFVVIVSLKISIKNENDVNRGLKNKITLPLTQVELANTKELQQQGLMFRQELCDSCGMLFEFEREEIVNFWMKDTLISLDMIFMDEDGKIVQIHSATKPLQELPQYSSVRPAQYVLEVNSGFAEKNNIIVGQYINIKELILIINKK